MSAFVVLSSGVVIEYPGASWIRWESSTEYIASLYEGDPDKNGKFVMKVPRGAIVSFYRPTTLRFPPEVQQQTLKHALELIAAAVDEIEFCGNWSSTANQLRELKKKMRRFDARSCCWTRE